MFTKINPMNLNNETMKEVQKVEIIINGSYLEKALNIIDSAAVSGYTVVKDTMGKGDRGMSCSDFDCVFSGTYILTVCENQEQLDNLLTKMSPLLKKVGGVCLVSQAKWLVH